MGQFCLSVIFYRALRVQLILIKHMYKLCKYVQIVHAVPWNREVEAVWCVLEAVRNGGIPPSLLLLLLPAPYNQ